MPKLFFDAGGLALIGKAAVYPVIFSPTLGVLPVREIKNGFISPNYGIAYRVQFYIEHKRYSKTFPVTKTKDKEKLSLK